MGQHLMAEDALAIRPSSHILIEVNVPTHNADPVELVLQKCCRDSGDILLAKDNTRDGRSIRYTVLLSSADEERMHKHINVLVAALKNGLIAFTFTYVPLLVKIGVSKGKSIARPFPIKEAGSKCYTSLNDPFTFYVTRPQDYLLDPEQLSWLSQYCDYCQVL